MFISLILCFITEWRLSWIFLIIIPISLFILLFVAKYVHPIFVKVFDTYDDLNQSVQENVDGIRVVKAFDRQEEQKKKFSGVSEFIYKNFSKAEKILAFNSPTLNAAIYISMLCIAYFGAKLVIESNNTTFSEGKLTTLFTFVQMIFNALMMLSMVYVMITIARNSAERINEILNEIPDIVSPKDGAVEVKDGDVDFDNVTFSYVEDKPVLKNINIHVKSGSTLGIIGSTGSGKTTLVSLIARLYDVQEGSVKVGGVDVKGYDIHSLREQVAVVLQKNTLFTGSIRDNLKWGSPNATDEEIMAACDVAEASSFVKSFPDGLNTKLDQGGTNVSGGQKQRLCIARALLKNPKVLILDDSTSACDTSTDSKIRNKLREFKKDVTKLIIAQRVLSIKDCDEIIVLDKGEVVDRGTNDYLLAHSPVYKSLYDSQLGGGGDFDASR